MGIFQTANVDEERQSDNKHDIHSKVASREMLRIECRLIGLSFYTVSREGQSPWNSIYMVIMVIFGCPSRCGNFVTSCIYTAEKHVVLFTYKMINDRVTHNEILSKVEMRNSSFNL